ncbi:MAG: tetratricopeptide repeat protein [Parachlamydiales bacterium]|nr:tetratricopeptide repeat protein [Parachlamydiales bacterium]
MRNKLLLILWPILFFGEDLSHLFQQAESLKSTGQFEEAIVWYKKRLESKENVDQVWASKMGLGDCYQRLNNWPEALYWYLEAFQNNPILLEPLLNIATYYRLRGENDLAYIFAKHGSRFTPSTDYRFDEELSIVAFYTRYREDGYRAISDLLMRKDVPWHIKSNAYQNLLYYAQNLKNTRFQKIEIDLPNIFEGSEERYLPLNPSLTRTEDGYAVICRSVNYKQKGAKEFHTNDPDGYIRTRNFLLHYDKEFKLLSSKEIVEDLPRERYPSSIVLGFEDCRIFEWNKELWFTTSARDTNPQGIPQISLCKLNGSEVERLIPLNGPDPTRCEKNWLPFVQEGDLNFIYWYDPFIVYKPNLFTGNCETVLEYRPNYDFSLFRGSAGPMPFDDGFLLLVHEPVIFNDGTRCYVHRFVYTDKRFMVKLVSKPFTFIHQGVEFCCSMTTDHSGKTLILALGIEDSSAYFCFTDLNLVRSLLCPLQPNL